MSILYIRDANGEFVEVPAIRGKSAYEYAKDGGYTGTEQEFREKLAFLMGYSVFGHVDENKHVVLKGNISDGSIIKLDMEDGTTIVIGEAQFYCQVANNLTNCTNSNAATETAKGKGYTATITANSGYELKSVTATMGGSPVTVSGGVITIAEVTGDIVITALAQEYNPTFTNLADPESADWVVGKRFNSAGALVDVDSGVNGATTNYVGGDFVAGDTIRVKNMDLTTYRVTVYDSAKTFITTTPLNNAALASYVSNVSVTSSEATFTINADTYLTNGGYIRFCGPLTGTSEDVIITKNEPIA